MQFRTSRPAPPCPRHHLAAVLTGLAGLALAAPALAGGGGGPDVIVGALTGTFENGSQGGPRYWGTSGGIHAYSIGTTSCNIGTEVLDWFDFGTPTPTLHPVIAQNLYIMEDCRFEQIGMSWLKHGFCALQGGLCGACTPVPGGCADQLGVGCSDPYGASLNGGQGGLGPRSEVNASSGKIQVWPFTTPGAGTLNGRMRVSTDDVNPALHPDARWFGEGQYVAQDDASAGNDDNNASWREVNPNGVALPWLGATQQQQPAIMAWTLDGATVQPVDVAGDGRFHVGHLVCDNGDGTWHYEYVVHNLNSDRNAGSFSVPIGAGATITNVGFHDVDHHSGEPYSTTDWTQTVTATEVTWATEAPTANPDANAIRWGTAYTFRFDANTPPQAAVATTGMFLPPTVGSPAAGFDVTAEGPSDGVPCPTDTNGDGETDVTDLVNVILDWGTDGSGNGGDVNGSGVVDVSDLVDVITSWGSCP